MVLLDVSVQASDRPVWIKEAKSGPYLHEGADVLRGFLPESLKIKNASLDDAIHALTPAAEARKAMRALQNPSGSAPDTAVIKPNPGAPACSA